MPLISHLLLNMILIGIADAGFPLAEQFFNLCLEPSIPFLIYVEELDLRILSTRNHDKSLKHTPEYAHLLSAGRFSTDQNRCFGTKTAQVNILASSRYLLREIENAPWQRHSC